MIEIDGGQKSGSGTILRLSVALAGILREPLHIYNIRGKRAQPGLRPQHLESVLTASKICSAEVEGAKLGSRELWFRPGEIAGSQIHAEIGSAGSIPMLLMTILPVCAFAKRSISLHVTKGGTDVRYSPTINYIKNVVLPTLDQMGLKTSLHILKYGYYPKGMGQVSLEVQPCNKLRPVRLEDYGIIKELRGVSVCTFLADRKVAERQAKTANEYLAAHNYNAEIQVANDTSNPLQKGSSLTLWAKSNTGALLGGDSIGELQKSSEAVGREAAENLYEEITSKASVDVHLADMLVPYVALAQGNSVYLTRLMTEHLETNIWLAQHILGVKFRVKKVESIYRIEKIES